MANSTAIFKLLMLSMAFSMPAMAMDEEHREPSHCEQCEQCLVGCQAECCGSSSAGEYFMQHVPWLCCFYSLHAECFGGRAPRPHSNIAVAVGQLVREMQ